MHCHQLSSAIIYFKLVSILHDIRMIVFPFFMGMRVDHTCSMKRINYYGLSYAIWPQLRPDQLYQGDISLQPSLTTVMIPAMYKQMHSHSLWRRANARTSALKLVTVTNLHFQLSWYNQITLLPTPTQHHSFFRNFHPLFICTNKCYSVESVPGRTERMC